MTTKPIQDVEPAENTHAILEKGLIDEFLKQKGYGHDDLKNLSTELAEN